MTTEFKLLDNGTIQTPAARLSYPHLKEAHAFNADDDPAYKAVLIFDGDTDLTPLIDLIKSTWVSSDYANLRPKNNPIRSNQEKDQAGYDDPNGHFISTKNAKFPPGLFDAQVQPVDRSKADQVFYPGCYVSAVIRPHAYNMAGNTGVSLKLECVQFLRDGERLAGTTPTNGAAVFAPVEVGSEVPDSAQTVGDLFA